MSREAHLYTKRYNYPHMKPRDVAIWERFIDKYPEYLESCQYDFSIGDIPPFMEQRSSPQGIAMQELYKLKIDVVGIKGDILYLIEVKPEAGASTIGQLLGYVALYGRDEKPARKVVPLIVTDVIKPNMEYLTEQQGVKIIAV